MTDCFLREDLLTIQNRAAICYGNDPKLLSLERLINNKSNFSVRIMVNGGVVGLIPVHTVFLCFDT